MSDMVKMTGIKLITIALIGLVLGAALQKSFDNLIVAPRPGLDKEPYANVSCDPDGKVVIYRIYINMDRLQSLPIFDGAMCQDVTP